MLRVLKPQSHRATDVPSPALIDHWHRADALDLFSPEVATEGQKGPQAENFDAFCPAAGAPARSGAGCIGGVIVELANHILRLTG